MDRVAVFVDAGYLFAAGSALLAGGVRQPRGNLRLNPAVAIGFLSDLALKVSGLPLLRIYWYDGMNSGRMSAEQTALANSSDVKMRLGLVNNAGQQKGIDSLIVFDLLELSRNRAISDAVLLSGDEDVRVGVHVAQSHGVRVHVVGINPARGTQAITLLQEADTTHVMERNQIETFVSLMTSAAGSASADMSKAPSVLLPAPTATPPKPAASTPASSFVSTCSSNVVANILDAATAEDLAVLITIMKASSGVPREYDGKLLARIRDGIHRDLTADEKKAARGLFVTMTRARAPASEERTSP